MLELEAAVARILQAVPPASPESVSLIDSIGRICLDHVTATIDLPPFDNSAMDGYAVRSGDIAGATNESPVRLRIIGRIAAGERWDGQIQAGTCVRIFTGSPLPQGSDAVVMQEDTRVLPDALIEVLDLARPWENIRFHGEDVKKGGSLIKAGDRIGAAALGLMAAAGVNSVTAGKRPRVGLLATGSELVEPGRPLGPGKIYESNRLALDTLTAQAGAAPKMFPLVPDTLDGTTSALNAALEQSDILVTCGGASVGEMDFIKPALQAIGGEMDFWKVAIRPGRPFVFGRAQAKLLFGLPGNPVSAFVTFLLLVRPALLRWQGAAEATLPTSHGILSERIANDGERRHFVRVQIDDAGRVRSAGVQASHVLSSMASANGLVDVPPRTSWEKGAAVKVMRWF
jgi:molybdopterin molybdotransferase